MNDFFVQKRSPILGVFAHPDDETFCKGSTYLTGDQNHPQLPARCGDYLGPDGGYGQNDYCGPGVLSLFTESMRSLEGIVPLHLVDGLCVRTCSKTISISVFLLVRRNTLMARKI